MSAYELEKEIKDHSESISLLAHEMRTSLGAIMGYIESLYDAKLTVKERFHCIRKVTDTIVQTSRTLEDLEHLNTIENGALSVRSVRFRLEEEMASILEFLRSFSRRSDVRLEITNQGPLPEYILSDPLRIREILASLLELVLQKTDRGSIRITMQLTAETSPRLEFLVDSTGYNYPKETLTEHAPWDEVNESEFLVPQIHGRTLIGVSLVKSLARVLGGEVLLEKSKLGHGLAVRVRIDPGPLEGTALREGLDLSPIERAHTVTPVQIPNLQGKKFLVIEDDDDISALMSSFLGKSKADVELARDGKEGLHKASGSLYDLIFMDLQIPHLNGLEVSRQLREKGITTPIIAITANASVTAKTKSLSAGCNLFLTKPFSMDSLLKLVKQVVA